MSSADTAVPADAALFVGVDVGTASARAGVFDADGRMLASAAHDLTIWRDGADVVEQSSDDVWRAVCDAVRGAVEASGADPDRIAGLGFDATCSLVVLGPAGQPLPVGPSGDPLRNIVMWMDHRALEQAERINALGHPVLRYVGGVISPEMQTPKLLWLREHQPDTYRHAWQFQDLADHLTWRATGDEARSACTVTCKWTYLAHEGRWDPDYFARIGLGDLADGSFARIGRTIVAPGTPLGDGLTRAAAVQLGLQPGIAVGAGLIDAHAGGVGTVGIGGDPQANLAYVFGTSSCTMTSTAEPRFVPGVWGPYLDAMVPGLWLNEGGQSAAGAAIDQLISFHPAAAEARQAAAAAGVGLPAWLAARAEGSVARPSLAVGLARGRHVVPEFLGNRAPFADPHARALIAGLGMAADVDDLVATYVAGLCGLGYGLRQIIEAQALAGAAGLPVVTVAAEEPVLLGSAILGATAAGAFPDVARAMAAMSHPADTYRPEAEVRPLHDLRYDAFRRLQDVARDVARQERAGLG